MVELVEDGMSESLAITRDVQDLLFREARTANSFTDEPVTDEQVAAIYELVKFAPTALNSQPLRIVLVRSDEAKQKLLKHMGGSNRDKTENAPLAAVLAADTNFHETLPRTFPHFPGAKDMFADDAAREQAARFNATLQLGYFIIGVRANYLKRCTFINVKAPVTGRSHCTDDCRFLDHDDGTRPEASRTAGLLTPRGESKERTR